MLDVNTGVFGEIDPEPAAMLRRIFEAGNREAPIFERGETIQVRGANFRVLAYGGKLLVLESESAKMTTGGSRVG